MPALRGVAVRLVVLCCLAWVALASDNIPLQPFTASAYSESSEKYLFPILYYGPNNQLAGLREVLALGRLLDRTVVLTALRLHSSEVNVGNSDTAEYKELEAWARSHELIPFEEILDVPALLRVQRVVTLSQLRTDGWNGTLNANIKIHTYSLDYFKKLQQDFGVVLPRKELFLNRAKFCDASHLPRTIHRLGKHRMVAISMFQDLIQHAGYASLKHIASADPATAAAAAAAATAKAAAIVTPDDACLAAYTSVSTSLASSAKVRELADRFIAEHLTPRFAAVHVRPYPDECLTAWQRQPYNETEAKVACHTRSLRSLMARFTARIMREHGVEGLFIITHPRIAAVVDALFAEGPNPQLVPQQPQHYSLKLLAERAGWLSTSLLAIVEQEIAGRAAVFIGTMQSSITGTIAQQRALRGFSANSTLNFPVQRYVDKAHVRR